MLCGQQPQHDQARHDEGAIADAADSATYASRSRRRTPRNRARWRAPATPRSAAACAGCAPSRRDRWRGSRGRSWRAPDQADENIFEGALLGAQILEGDIRRGEIVQQRRDADRARRRCRRCRRAPCRPPKAPADRRASAAGICASGAVSDSVRRFLPSLRISSFLSSTRINSPLLMTPIAVGHLLGLFDDNGWSE